MPKKSKVLRLSSPHMKGERVKVVQRLLVGKNVFKKNFRPGRIDGEFGPGTAGAVHRAKWFMGYPRTKVNNMAGDSFVEFLSGKKKLPASWRLRSKRRQAKINKLKEMRKVSFSIAMRYAKMGYEEVPAGSNRTKFGKWYSLDGNPWCAMFITYCWVHAGSKAWKKGSRWAYCPFIKADALKKTWGTTVIADPQRGDDVLYHFGRGIEVHIGKFYKWTDRKAGAFLAIEGNTSNSSDDNGGKCMIQPRTLSQVSCFIRTSK